MTTGSPAYQTYTHIDKCSTLASCATVFRNIQNDTDRR